MTANSRTSWIAVALVVVGVIWLAAIPDPRSEGVPESPSGLLFIGPLLCLGSGFALSITALVSKWKAHIKGRQSRRGIVRELKYALQALAMTADVQMQLYAPITDVHSDLLNDCDHWVKVYLDNFKDELSDEQRIALKAVVTEMDTWTNDDSAADPADDLATRPFWARMRAVSATALDAMEWPIKPPPREVPDGKGCWRRLPET